ncbi:hypothetical protein HMI54_003007 [Coelomomyces lativittatus]|nr:hypothetical protein HMI55_000198 [Coelomomyces lativittatus]KAJ1512744.1 hypothetical protein HMI56_003616 [Coelomomyces lativittatus]KAJ1518026.1 hypothetical protein HMI54_003007 [Coelomomyces lativittatus]
MDFARKNNGSIEELDEILIKALNLNGDNGYLPSEDCIKFNIYLDCSTLSFTTSKENTVEDKELSCTQDKKKINEDLSQSGSTFSSTLGQELHLLQSSIIDHCKILTKDYLWHKDPVSLLFSEPVHDSSSTIFRFAKGHCYFSDNINDEWFVVHILVELSKIYPNLVIEAHDSDGQFLLIECAEHLPSWLQPENSLNRVYICNGQLHFIPFTLSNETPTFETSVKLILDQTLSTLASDTIQTHFLNKIRQTQSVPCLHWARARLSRETAGLLTRCPQLIAPVVEAVYTRDPIAMKFCERMIRFTPHAENLVDCSVLFTRCLYAQLVSVRFPPPAPFLSTSISTHEEEIGMKLTCGLEILFQDSMYQKSVWSHTPRFSLKAHLDRLLSLPLISDSELNQTSPNNENWMKVTEEDFRNWKTPLSSSATLDAQRENLKKIFEKFEKGESGVDGIDYSTEDESLESSTFEDVDLSDSNPNEREHFSDVKTFDEGQFFRLFNNERDLPFQDHVKRRMDSFLETEESDSVQGENSSSFEYFSDSEFIEEGLNENTDRKELELFFESMKSDTGSGPASALFNSLQL